MSGVMGLRGVPRCPRAFLGSGAASSEGAAFRFPLPAASKGWVSLAASHGYTACHTTQYHNHACYCYTVEALNAPNKPYNVFVLGGLYHCFCDSNLASLDPGEKR
jgi:hypothetical protein